MGWAGDPRPDPPSGLPPPAPLLLHADAGLRVQAGGTLAPTPRGKVWGPPQPKAGLCVTPSPDRACL